MTRPPLGLGSGRWVGHRGAEAQKPRNPTQTQSTYRTFPTPLRPLPTPARTPGTTHARSPTREGVRNPHFRKDSNEEDLYVCSWLAFRSIFPEQLYSRGISLSNGVSGHGLGRKRSRLHSAARRISPRDSYPETAKVSEFEMLVLSTTENASSLSRFPLPTPAQTASHVRYRCSPLPPHSPLSHGPCGRGEPVPGDPAPGGRGGLCDAGRQGRAAHAPGRYVDAARLSGDDASDDAAADARADAAGCGPDAHGGLHVARAPGRGLAALQPQWKRCAMLGAHGLHGRRALPSRHPVDASVESTHVACPTGQRPRFVIDRLLGSMPFPSMSHMSEILGC